MFISVLVLLILVVQLKFISVNCKGRISHFRLNVFLNVILLCNMVNTFTKYYFSFISVTENYFNSFR